MMFSGPHVIVTQFLRQDCLVEVIPVDLAQRAGPSCRIAKVHQKSKVDQFLVLLHFCSSRTTRIIQPQQRFAGSVLPASKPGPSEIPRAFLNRSYCRNCGITYLANNSIERRALRESSPGSCVPSTMWVTR